MPESVFSAIRLESIIEPAHRLRETIDDEQLVELADSMGAEGLHQPIGVRGPDATALYEVVWGHRRLLAARLLQWATIDARIFPASFDPLLAAISENLQRTDLTPVEEAHAIQRFVERGHSLAAVARLFRRSAPWVAARLDLLSLPTNLRDGVQAGVLSLGVAAALRDVDHDAYRAELIAEAVRTGATAATAEVWRAHFLADRDRIIGNGLVVQDILARRDTWVIYTRCEACDVEVPYEETRSWRLCAGCGTDVERAIQEAHAPGGAVGAEGARAELKH